MLCWNYESKVKLYLTYTEFRRLYGQDSYNPPSRFINEIPNEHIEFVRPKQSYTTSYYATVSSNAAEVSESEFNLGDAVKHKTFGEGIILNMEGSGEASRLQINFGEAGTKWLVVGYAHWKNLMKLKFVDKGIIDYRDCLNEMLSLIKTSPEGHEIWYLEHPSVFTVGISEKEIKRGPQF